MAHGYNCLKEFYLDKYAAAIASAGHVVLAYDHRNFGDSDGEPRQELDPWVQVRDYRHAITFAQTLDGVDPDRVGVWGSSYAGGHVLVVGRDRQAGRLRGLPGADDQRLGVDVAPDSAAGACRPAPRPSTPTASSAFAAGAPKMVPMVVDPAEGGAASHASADAWEFFTGKHAPPEDQWRFSKWRNEITLRSLELYSEYEPGSFIERIAPTPLLMVARR